MSYKIKILRELLYDPKINGYLPGLRVFVGFLYMFGTYDKFAKQSAHWRRKSNLQLIKSKKHLYPYD